MAYMQPHSHGMFPSTAAITRADPQRSVHT